MSKFRVLCLTDHDTHSKENSLYSILSQMSESNRCDKIVVASRSAKINTPFFAEKNFERIFGLQVKPGFDYENSKRDLHENIFEINPNDFDIIFLRLPRPVSDEFLEALEFAFEDKCFVNRPRGIISCSSKAVLMNFQDVCPPVKLCYSAQEIIDFSQKHNVVLKPLREYGGKGIIRIKGSIANNGSEDMDVLDYLSSIESTLAKEGVLAMKYLENVKLGDKRLIVVDGEVLAASLRLPSKESWLCNVALGGKSVQSQADSEELEIIERINPYLKKKGILIYGADTLVDDDGKRTLSEINALSIGGFPQAEAQTGIPIIKMTIDKIFDYAEVHFNG